MKIRCKCMFCGKEVVIVLKPGESMQDKFSPCCKAHVERTGSKKDNGK